MSKEILSEGSENIQEVAEKIQAEYALSPDGTIVKAQDIKENPEANADQMK